MYWGEHYWGMHAFWWIFWVILVAALLYWAWPATPSPREDSALDELRRRYAAGEIDDDEYRHRLDVLTSADVPAPAPRTKAKRDPRSGGSAAA